jgi:hypothetical protein
MSVAGPTPASDGCLYIASATDKGIRQLRPVPLERQAKLLAAAGDFQGALELLTQMEDEEVAAAAATAGSDAVGSEAAGNSKTTAAAAAAAGKRQQLEDVLRLRFGYHLFDGALQWDHLLSPSVVSSCVRTWHASLAVRCNGCLEGSAHLQQWPSVFKTARHCC